MVVNNSIQGQFQHEHKTWHRLLEFFTQENTILKNRLAEVVDQTMDKSFLALAEHFQNKFITKDEYIFELQQDIEQLDIDVLNKKAPAADFISLVKRQEKLRNEMEFFEKDFNSLKNAFNKQLSSDI
ncbi:MAG: hypothetical protein ABIT96_10595 [Ferruginibacter sp.]